MTDSDVRELEARRQDWRPITDRFQILVLQNPRAADQLLVTIRAFLDAHGVSIEADKR